MTVAFDTSSRASTITTRDEKERLLGEAEAAG
jgi:hypothetical protein